MLSSGEHVIWFRRTTKFINNFCFFDVHRRDGKVLGGIAFLYLNYRGHDALLLDEIDLKNPSRQYLARPGEDISAIYVWSVAGYGRAAIGLGNVAEYLRRPRFADADYYAQPSSADGRGLLKALCFKPIASFQPDLWYYERPWNRPSSTMAAPSVSIQNRSHADARY